MRAGQVELLRSVRDGFRASGWAYRVAGIEVVQNLDETFAMLLEQGLVSENLLTQYAGSLRFEPPLGNAGSPLADRGRHSLAFGQGEVPTRRAGRWRR